VTNSVYLRCFPGTSNEVQIKKPLKPSKNQITKNLKKIFFKKLHPALVNVRRCFVTIIQGLSNTFIKN